MTSLERSIDLSLVCRARSIACALPLASVIETMRPQPLEPLSGAPDFVSGVALIRGAPVPVVDAGQLLGGAQDRVERLVTLRTERGTVALAFEAVLGVRDLGPARLSALPPLLQAAGRDTISTIGRLDAALLVVLQSGRLVPEELLARLEPEGRV